MGYKFLTLVDNTGHTSSLMIGSREEPDAAVVLGVIPHGAVLPLKANAETFRKLAELADE